MATSINTARFPNPTYTGGNPTSRKLLLLMVAVGTTVVMLGRLTKTSTCAWPIPAKLVIAISFVVADVVAPALGVAKLGIASTLGSPTILRAAPVAAPLGATFSSTSISDPVALLIMLVRPSRVSSDTCCIVATVLADADDTPAGANTLALMNVPLVVAEAEALFVIATTDRSSRPPSPAAVAAPVPDIACMDAVAIFPDTLAVVATEPA